jgi:hypothetical protein
VARGVDFVLAIQNLCKKEIPKTFIIRYMDQRLADNHSGNREAQYRYV